METIHYYNTLKKLICCCAFDIQQVFLFRDITGEPVSRGVSLRSWCIYIIAGKGYAAINKEKYSLNRASLVILQPGAEFCITPDEGESLSYYAIGFIYKDVFDKEGKGIAVNSFTGCFKLTNIIKIEKLLEEIYRSSLSGDLDVNPKVKCAFYNFMLGLWEDIRSDLNNMAIYKRIEKITDFIYENYKEKICIGDLSKRCNISKEYFIRAFKNYTGLSPGQFIMNVRINKAKELLLAETLLVKEVAFLTGFKDEVYFSKQFKKIVGIPPRYYSAKNKY